MQNPFKSEDAAFRFLLGTIAYFALIVAASLIATWLALVTFVALTAGAVVLLRRSASVRSSDAEPERAAVEDTWRIVVLAPRAPHPAALVDVLAGMCAGVAESILVVAPAFDPERLVGSLRNAGLDAHGTAGAAEPLQALEDALRGFTPDAVVVAGVDPASPPDADLMAAVTARVGVPVTQV